MKTKKKATAWAKGAACALLLLISLVSSLTAVTP